MNGYYIVKSELHVAPKSIQPRKQCTEVARSFLYRTWKGFSLPGSGWKLDRNTIASETTSFKKMKSPKLPVLASRKKIESGAVVRVRTTLSPKDVLKAGTTPIAPDSDIKLSPRPLLTVVVSSEM